MALRLLNWKEKKRKSLVDTTLLHLLLPLSLPARLRITEPARHHYDHPSLALPLHSHEWAFHQSYSLSPQFLSLLLSVSLFHSAGGLLLPAHRGSSDYAQRRRSRGVSKRKLYAVTVAVKVWWRNCCAGKVISKGSRKEKGYEMKWDGIHNWRTGRRETLAFFFYCVGVKITL